MGSYSYTSPEWANSALLTIDTQRDVTLPRAPAEIAGTKEAASVMRRLVAAFRQEGKPIVHLVRLYRPDGSNVDLCRREAIEQGKSVILLSGGNGAELVDELKPSDEVSLDTKLLLGGELQEIGQREWIMYKPRWGAFYHPPCKSIFKNSGLTPSSSVGATFLTVREPRYTKPAKGLTEWFSLPMLSLLYTSEAHRNWSASG